MLRPGLHVLRRSAGELQVGLDPRHALVLPDREPYRSVLDAVTRPGTDLQQRAYDAGVLALLEEAGLLADLNDVLSLVAQREARLPGSAGDVASVVARCGDDAAAVLGRRAAARVEVHTHGRGCEAAEEQLHAALARAGCQVAGAAGAAGAAPPEEPTLGVLVAVGEPPREMLDAWLRESTPHLVVRLSEGHATLGPFVLPGRTACLRCVDAHLTDVDRAWPLLVAQQATASALGRLDAVPEPCDPTLATLVAAWAARDVVTHLEGGSPSTASGTLRLSPDLTSLETQTWTRHPGCGCTWD